jgi:hypothetical protein
MLPATDPIMRQKAGSPSDYHLTGKITCPTCTPLR